MHGVHERQVLPGFDDAVIESVLWMRKPNIQKYAGGKWANPKALSGYSFALGLMGLVYCIGIDNDSDNDRHIRTAMVYWFFAYAFLQWGTIFIFALRQEVVHLVSALLNTALIASFAFAAVNNSGLKIGGGFVDKYLILCFAVIRLVFFLYSVWLLKMSSNVDLTSIDIISYGCLGISLLVASTCNLTAAGVLGSQICLSTTVIFEVYGASAELLNSSAQKQILPIRFEWMNGNKRVPRHSVLSDEENMISITSSEDSSNDEPSSNFAAPGEEILLGQSDFGSPIVPIFVGLWLYASVKSMALCLTFVDGEQSSTMIYQLSSLMNVVVQTPALIISAIRGQTTYAVFSFSFWLQGVIQLLVILASTTSDRLSLNGDPLMVAIAILQILWLVGSHRAFRPLSFTVMLHITGVLADTISKQPILNAAMQEAFTIVSIVIFAFMALLSLVMIGILLGCYEDVEVSNIAYSKIHNSSDGGRTTLHKSNNHLEDERCPMATSRTQQGLDECIKILNDGGVCCIPTDTVYCLACKANNPEGIKRIYEIKSRPSEKPLSLWLSSIDEIKNVGPEGKGWGPTLFAFMESIWPGCVSLVVSRGEWLNRLGVGSAADLIGTQDSIALRVPDSTITMSLLKETGPLAITSANPSGAADCSHHNQVDDEIAKKIDFILADGASPKTIASSVIDVRDLEQNKIFFYRIGCVPEAEIWAKARTCRTLTMKEGIFSSTISESNLKIVKPLMNFIINTMHCDTWHIYCLHKPNANFHLGLSKSDFVPWKIASKQNPRVLKIFETGISYYTFNDEEVRRDHSSEMLVPINHMWGVCAVLHLCNKRQRDRSGSLQPFDEEDLNSAKFASTILLKHLDIDEVSDNDNVSNINNIQRDAMSIVKFGEGGGKGGDTSRQHAGLMNVNRRASSAF